MHFPRVCVLSFFLVGWCPLMGQAQPVPASQEGLTEAPSKPLTREQLARREALRLYGLGQLRVRQDRLVDATQILEEAAVLDPESAAIQKTLATLLLALGRQQDALKAIRKTLEHDPGDYETWSLYARQLRSSGEREAARDALARARGCRGLANKLDTRLQLTYDYGVLCEETKDYAQAIDAFDEVVRILDNPKPLLELGGFSLAEIQGQASATYERIINLCIQSKKYDQAAAFFARAKDKYPVLARRLRFDLARIAYAQGRLEEAHQQLEAYLHTQPRDLEPFELRSTILRDLGRQAEILPGLRELSDHDSKNTALRRYLAGQYLQEKHWAEAQETYLRLAEEDPSADVYEGLFKLYQSKWGDVAGTNQALHLLNSTIEKAARKGKAENGDPAAAAQARAMLQAIRQNVALASKLVAAGKEALRARGRGPAPLHGQTLFYLAVMARRTQQLAEAEEFYRGCLENASDQRSEHLLYAGLLDVLWQAHKHEAILEVCRYGLDNTQATHHGMFHQHRSRALVLLNRIDEAVAAADKAVEISREDDLFWTRSNRVRILMRAERHEKAVQEAEAMLRDYAQPGQQHEIRLLLSNAYSAVRDFDSAEKQLQIVLREDPEHVTANNDLGYFWADRGKNLAEAERLIRKAVALDEQQRRQRTMTALDEDPANAAYLDSLGWVLFRRGRIAEARTWLEKAASLAHGEEDPTIWDHLGDVYLKLGEPAKARSAWQKAVRLYEVEKWRKPDENYKELKTKLQQHSDNR